jgi:hypothetical protein
MLVAYRSPLARSTAALSARCEVQVARAAGQVLITAVIALHLGLVGTTFSARTGGCRMPDRSQLYMVCTARLGQGSMG